MATCHATSDFGGRYFLWAQCAATTLPALPYFGIIIIIISIFRTLRDMRAIFIFSPFKMCPSDGKTNTWLLHFLGRKAIFPSLFSFCWISEDSRCKSWRMLVAPVVMLLELKMNRPSRKSYFLINAGESKNWNIVREFFFLRISHRRCVSVWEPDKINSFVPST